ncbi:troponin I-like [Sinocyclocheilus rhinocerous]|uniref:troponin I-like n=1 Tax=Sinocyclocheilus rhinocerous TaxID=307959 RepID=UPI0007B7C450|nr:PREDICTED: troponin I-like [Sinocyclocheilus rhinocerous]
MAWISAIRRTDIHFADIPRSLKVCSRHFHSGKPAYEMDESHPDWAPTLHLGHSEVTATVSDRHARRQHRHHLRESEGGGQNEQNNVNEDERDGVQEDAGEEGYGDQAEAGAAEEEEHGDQAETRATEEEENREQTETVKPAAKRLRAECQLCEQSSAELTRLLQENRELRSELNKLKMDEEFFKDNTEKVQYYTGLPCFNSFCYLCRHHRCAVCTPYSLVVLA